MTKKQVKFRIDEELLAKFDKQHPNRAAALRALVRKSVARSDASELPSEELAKAYSVLVEFATEYDNGALRCVAGEVAPMIANRCNVEGGADAVRYRVFPELRRQGFLRPRAGFLWVKPRSVDPETFAEGEVTA